MDPVRGASIGLVFLALGFGATFLMYHLWGYAFDKETRKSAAPRWLMLTHRGIGYAFAIVYVFMMVKMVPRMWEYQVELPPRTVAHLLLGFSIGVILIVKISIMRFFRHLEEWMPYLGTALLLCTVLLLGLSVPFAFRERALANSAAGGDVFSAASRARVAEQLKSAELPSEAKIDDLATVTALRRGRSVLLNKCVKCHDLKTILARPRQPNDWFQTVTRMSEKPALFAPISMREELEVSAYLVAITPDLQRSRKMQREYETERQSDVAEAMGAAADAGDNEGAAQAPATSDSPAQAPAAPGPGAAPPSTAPTAPSGEAPAPSGGAAAPAPAPPKAAPPPPDPKLAKAAYEKVCSKCHELSDVDDAPPKSERGVQNLINRMVENGLKAKPQDLRNARWYLINHFVKKSI
jgi:hypothetical protein